MRGEWSGSGSRVKRSMGRQPFGFVDSRLALSTAAHYGCRSVNDLGGPGGDLLSRVLRHSTISAEEFNGRVRDGIGFGLLAQVTGPAKDNGKQNGLSSWSADMDHERDQADRAISTGKLNASPRLHTRPINVVVFHGSDREYSFRGGFPA